MIKVNIKAKGRRLFIPVPYVLLHLFIAVLSSKRLLAFVNNAIKKDSKKAFEIPQIHRSDLKPLLNELSNCKGLLIVETTLNDGTEVSVRL